MTDIDKQILDKYATLVVKKDAIWKDGNGVAQVNQDKSLEYANTTYSEDIVLWVAPKDCLRIEFESKDTNKIRRWINETEAACKALELDYCITDHKGKSPYLNIFNLKNIPVNEDNKFAKLLLASTLLSFEAKRLLDKTNLGWTLSPVIGHEHWKPKYKGAKHKILRGMNPLEQKN